MNSTPIVRGTRTDQLADDESTRRWLRAQGLTVEVGERQLLREARNRLQAVVRAEQSPAALEALLSGVVALPTVDDQGLTWEIQATGARKVIVDAVAEWDELRRSQPGRLRPCANDECHLFLLDRSRSNSARWCSMATCGNRLKARRHHERAVRQAGDSPPPADQDRPARR
nr:CGNR zinc finger domain-containing protein [Micromonospora sp. HNM0581]